MSNSVASLVLATLLAATAASAGAAEGCFRGINLSGAEFGALGGTVNKDYTWPSAQTVDYFAAKGFDTVRLPFRWERLQPKLMKDLDEAEVNRADSTGRRNAFDHI